MRKLNFSIESCLKEYLGSAEIQTIMSIDTHSGSDDEAGAIPDLLHSEVLDAFDRETFERDGYWGVGRRGHRCRLQPVDS